MYEITVLNDINIHFTSIVIVRSLINYRHHQVYAGYTSYSSRLQTVRQFRRRLRFHLHFAFVYFGIFKIVTYSNSWASLNSSFNDARLLFSNSGSATCTVSTFN